MIIGERRCGTTSLYHWMRSHPDIYLYPKADFSFFLDSEVLENTAAVKCSSEKGWEAQHSMEDYESCFRDGERALRIGFKCADLFYWQRAHERIARFSPNCKFIVILRDPVKRAWSHYWNEVGKAREKRNFPAAVESPVGAKNCTLFEEFHLSYLDRGFYFQTLLKFLKTFELRNLLFITTDQMKLAPDETLRKVYDFIDVDSEKGLENAGTRVNENWVTVPKVWATLPLIRNVEQGYRRASEAVIVRTAKSGYRRRLLRKKTQWIFQRPVSAIPMPKKLEADLRREYNDDICRLGEFASLDLSNWRL